MLNPHPYNCDICGTAKQPSNNWLIGNVAAPVVDGTITKDGITVNVDVQLFSSVIVSLWDATLASIDNVVHLCGIECAAKWSTKKFDELKK